MKRLNKKSVILAALGLLIGSGAYLNYQMSKTDTTGMSDLTLANLEAMAWDLDGELDMDGEGAKSCTKATQAGSDTKGATQGILCGCCCNTYYVNAKGSGTCTLL